MCIEWLTLGLKLHKRIARQSIREIFIHMYIYLCSILVIAVHMDGLALLGARKSASTMMNNYGLKYTKLLFNSLKSSGIFIWQWTIQSLVQMSVVFSANTISEPTLN